MTAERRAARSVAAFVPQMLYAVPGRASSSSSSRASKQLLIIELSYTAQFYKYLRTVIDLPAGRTHVFKRSGGKNLTVSEVEIEIRKRLKSRLREGGAGMTHDRGDGYKPDDYKIDLKPVWCPGCGDFGVAQRALSRDGGAAARAVEHGRRLGHRLLVAAARVRRDVRIQQPARPRAADRDRHQGRAARS